MNAPSPIVTVEDLRVHFRMGRHATLKAVDGISLDINSGEVFGVIGESGSGKSTLGRALVALRQPTDGRILHEGVDFSAISRRELRRLRQSYQIVFQDPEGALDPRLTVHQSVREPLDIGKAGSKNDRDRVALECLDRVGLGADFANRYPHELSGGQKQRVNIARVLATRPKLIVFDEAVAALDVSIQAEIINLLVQLQRDLGLTYVFISHDLNVVSHVSQRVAVMYLGAIVELAPVDSLMQGALHPYTRALLQSRPNPIPASMRARRSPALKGEIPSALNPPSGCHFRTRCPHAVSECEQQRPRWKDVGAGRWVACHLTDELALAGSQ